MELEVKLYYYHDLDLISIYRQGALWFQKATVLALKAFCEQKYIRLKSSEPCRKLALRRTYRYRIYLTEAKDAEVISLLNRIQPGHRNSFIKTVLRQYFCEFPADYFKDPADKAFFDECTASMHDVDPIACAMPRKASGNYRKKNNGNRQGKISGHQAGKPPHRHNGTDMSSAVKNMPAAHTENSGHTESAPPMPEPHIQDPSAQEAEDELTMLFMDLTGG